MEQPNEEWTIEEATDLALSLIESAARRATEEHGNYNSLHEFYAVLLEETDELWDEIKKRHESREPEAIAREIIDVAAVAVRGLAELLMHEGVVSVVTGLMAKKGESARV